MANVSGSPQQTTHHTPNVVISTTPAKLLAVKYADGGAKVQMAMVVVFGKDTNDGKPGVFVLVDSNMMRDNVTIASPHIRQGVLQALASSPDAPLNSDDIPDSLLGGGGALSEEQPKKRGRKKAA